MPDLPPPNDTPTGFGPNQGLVDELYEQYLTDKNSVDQAWWNSVAGYRPGEASARSQGGSTTATAARAGCGRNGSASSSARTPITSAQTMTRRRVGEEVFITVQCARWLGQPRRLQAERCTTVSGNRERPVGPI